MIPLRQFLCLILILVGSQVQGENAVTLNGRIDTNANQSPHVWIGVFEMPLRPDGDAVSWTRVESSKFTLNIPSAEKVQLVALRKDSLPIVRSIRPASIDRQIDLKFQDGNSVEGVVLSTDGFPVSMAILRLDRADLPNMPIPKHVQTVWNSDAEGRFKIGGLAPRTEHAIEVELSYVPNETFAAKISNRKLRRLELRLSDAHFVQGHVEDFEQARVSDATVAFRLLRERRSTLNTATDANGEFQVGPFVRSEKVWLRARHDERGTSERLLATSGERGVVLVITPLVQVVGRWSMRLLANL